jgi:pimeloyl-ACP methyl ester carboxylesterase
MTVRRAYADVGGSQVHYAEAGAEHHPVVLLLHQTPRSCDEYRDVLPLLAAAGLRAIAMDTPGYGASDPAPRDTVEDYAATAVALLDALGVRTASIVGHHTGGVIAVEVAARAPDRVDALVLSSTPYLDAEMRGRPGHGVDDVEAADDGSHLVALWAGRRPFYQQAGQRDLLERFVRDALAAGLDRSAAGHTSLRRYRMEERLPLVGARILLIGATDDPFARPQLDRLGAALPAADRVLIEGGTVPLPDGMPEDFAAAVAAFVKAG